MANDWLMIHQPKAHYTPYSNLNVRVCVVAIKYSYPPLSCTKHYTHTNPFNPSICQFWPVEEPVQARTIQ